MDDPVRDIEGVIRSLAQGSPNEQAAALNHYFIPAAEFIHPFCRVPPFQKAAVPFIGEANSRQLILAIYRWYRIISPRIDLKVNSVQFDESRNVLYVDINQRMALFLVPFYAAHVNLVTRLDLVKAGGQSQAESYQQVASRPHSGHGLAKAIDNGELPSFAEVAKTKKRPLSCEHESASEPEPTSEGQYYITKQEDLYQVNEWIKFIVPFGIGDFFISLGQQFVTALCLVGTIVFFPLVWILTHGGDSGNVMPPVSGVQDDGQVTWTGVGAEWAKRTFSPLNSIGKSAYQGIVINVQENACALVEKGENLASNVQQRTRKVVHSVQAREEALVKSAQQKAKGFADDVQQGAKDLVHHAHRSAENVVHHAQRSAEHVLSSAQEKECEIVHHAQEQEREIVHHAQAKEEHHVAHLQGKEEQGAEKMKQWWAANKKC